MLDLYFFFLPKALAAIFPFNLSFTSNLSIDRDNYSVTRLAQKTAADEINAFLLRQLPGE